MHDESHHCDRRLGFHPGGQLDELDPSSLAARKDGDTERGEIGADRPVRPLCW